MLRVNDIAAVKPRFARFAKRHPAQAETLVQIAGRHAHVFPRPHGVDETDVAEEMMIGNIVAETQEDEHRVGFGIIGTILIGVIVKLIVEFILEQWSEA